MTSVCDSELFAAQRFQIPLLESETLRARVSELESWWKTVPGYLDSALVQNLDDPQLWLLWSRWENVGSYRRGLGGQAKYLWLPIMQWVIDEPTAYAHPDELATAITVDE